MIIMYDIVFYTYISLNATKAGKQTSNKSVNWFVIMDLEILNFCFCQVHEFETPLRKHAHMINRFFLKL